MSMQNMSWGPGYAKTAAVGTGAGSWIKPRSLLSTWGYTITAAGSTSTVTTKGRLEGTMSDSTAPTSAEISTLSTKNGTGYGSVTGKPARQVRWNTTTLTSTSSTAPNVSVLVGGTL